MVPVLLEDFNSAVSTDDLFPVRVARTSERVSVRFAALNSRHERQAIH